MEVNKLPGIILMFVLVGMILGVGILVLDKFGSSTREETSVSETVEILSGAGQLDNAFVVSVERFYNSTVNFTAVTNYNVTAGGVVTTSGLADLNYTVAYTYDKNVTTTDVAEDTSAAILPIATTWLGLIVTVLVLSLILYMVIRSFGKGR